MEIQTNYKFQNYLAKKDKERREAFHSQNYITYFKLCNELGMIPENEEFYNLGKLEIQLNEGNIYKD